MIRECGIDEEEMLRICHVRITNKHVFFPGVNNLSGVSKKISKRSISIFEKDAEGKRPGNGDDIIYRVILILIILFCSINIFTEIMREALVLHIKQDGQELLLN
jgi:hypothetical protein